MSSSEKKGPSLEEIIQTLNTFWKEQGCSLQHGYDVEVGAATFNPHTFIGALGKNNNNVAYVEPCRRPKDGRYGIHPNRLQKYFQYQVVMKPPPKYIQSLYLDSLKKLGIKTEKHDIRFVHDDWESPTLGAWGLGWEVWIDGMEVTQFTYFQMVGNQRLEKITVEITYGLERIAMYLQEVESVYDLRYNNDLTYKELFHESERQFSTYQFELANVKRHAALFDEYADEWKTCMQHKNKDGNRDPLYYVAADMLMKCLHLFNVMDARGAVSHGHRTEYVRHIQKMAADLSEAYLQADPQDNVNKVDA